MNIQGVQTPRNPKKANKDRTPPFDSSMSIEDKIRTILQEKRWENYNEDIRRARVYLLMDLYYRGYQNLGPWDSNKMAWPSYDDDPLDYMENRFRRNALINAGSLIRMEPTPVLRPASGNPNDMEASIAAADAWDKAKEEIAYDSLIADKSLQKVLFGTTFIYSGYQISRRFGTMIVPKMKMESMEIPGAAICSQCGMSAEAGTPMCPECMAPMEQYPPMLAENETQVGTEEKERGQLFSTAFSPLEVKIRSKVKGGLVNQPYLLRCWREDVELLNYVFPGSNFQPSAPKTRTSTSPGADAATRYQTLLATLPGNVFGNQSPYWTASQYYTDTDVMMGWIKPQCYRGDKELEKEAPDGLMAVLVGDEVPEWRPERLDDVWTQEVYYPNPHSAYGDGMFDDAPIQRMINQVGQLQHQHMEYDTIPLRLYESDMILETDIGNNPKKKWISVATSQDKGLDKAVRDLPAQQLSFDVQAWKQQLYGADQDISGATDPVAGKIAGANTPYSAQILAVEQGQTRFLPSARTNKISVKDHVRQVLKLAQQHWTDPRTLAEIDQNTGSYSWKEFTGADLSRGSWTVAVMDSDFKPRTRGEQLAAMEQGRALGIDFLSNPKMRFKAFENLGISPDGDMLNTQVRRANRIIQMISEGQTIAPDPIIDDGLIQVPVMIDYLASQQGDQLKEKNEQAWHSVMAYITTLMQIAAMKQSAMMNMGLPPMNGPVGPQGPMPPPPAGGPQQGPQPQKTEHAQSPVPEGSQQPLPNIPARAQQAAGAI